MRTCLCICPNSRGARTLSPSKWVARCCAQWAGGMSWSNAGPGHSNGNTSAPCCLMWASPCAPPASRYSVYKRHGAYNLVWTSDKVYLFFDWFCFLSPVYSWLLCVYFLIDVSQWGLWTPGASTQLLSLLSQAHRWTKLIHFKWEQLFKPFGFWIFGHFVIVLLHCNIVLTVIYNRHRLSCCNVNVLHVIPQASSRERQYLSCLSVGHYRM